MHAVELSLFERLTLRFSWVLIIATVLGLILFPEFIWDDFIKIYIWDPILKDSSAAGDSSYTLVNTSLYVAIMFLCVIVFQIYFRKWKLPTDDKMMWALIAWVCVAPALRVLEDADFFGDKTDVLFISPIIHLHLAFWLIFSGLMGYIACKYSRTEGEEKVMLLAIFGLMYVLFVSIMYQPEWRRLEISTTFAMSGVILGLLGIYFVIHNTWNWHPVSRGMLVMATAILVSGFGHWMQLAMTPWPQESGFLPKENPVLMPIIVAVGIPAIVSFFVYRMGVQDLRHLRLCGYEPGIIPPGITVKEWEDAENDEHAIEMLSGKAILATPMVAGMLFGQLCDGLATMLGIDWFGYAEKHPVSDAVIQYGNSLDILGEGAWLFAIVKAILVCTIVYLFSQLRVEYRHQHFRVLIVLAVMIVGMAPGLRDVGRLILGV